MSGLTLHPCFTNAFPNFTHTILGLFPHVLEIITDLNHGIGMKKALFLFPTSAWYFRNMATFGIPPQILPNQSAKEVGTQPARPCSRPFRQFSSLATE